MKNTKNGSLMSVEGIHRVKKTRANGAVRFYYYAYRGGPQFWMTDQTPEREPYPKAFFRNLKRVLSYSPKPYQPAPGTLEDAIAAFKEDDLFKLKRKSTRKTYQAYFDKINERFGCAKLHWFERRQTRGLIYKWRDEAFEGKDRAGDLALTTLVRVLNWCEDQGRIHRHVAGNMQRKHKADRSNVIWLPEELKALISQLPNENSRKLVRFAAISGLRRGDICKLQPTADKGDWLDLTTEKRLVSASVPVTREMREIIDSFYRERQKRPHSPFAMFFNSRFRPYTPDGLSSVFTRAKNAAGIDKRFHDLKGTACTYYKAQGFTNEEIARFVGWKRDTVEEIVHTYITKETMMRSAITRLQAAQSG